MKNLFTIIFCLLFFSLQAQDDYYYNGSEKIQIKKSDNSFISFNKPTQTMAKGFKNVKTFSSKGFTILEDKESEVSAKDFKTQKQNQISPAFLLNKESNFKMFPTKTIRVKLKPNINTEDITKLFQKNDILKIEKKYGILRVHIEDINKILEIANEIYESGLAEFSIPDFYIPMELNQINDPLFSQQFQMHNTGQSIDGVSGVNNIDCNAYEAWNLTLGNNITVAVFDQGLENHEDFGSRLIGGYTPATNGNGTPEVNNATHGMNCAGVIGASDDNLGLRGVAPNVNLLSVNIFANGTTSGDIADGIQWAINNGADVLSNSWSYANAPCNFTNVDIENAIQNAITNGRNGNGAVIVFSSGNTGGCVNYPARNSNVISVGAVDNRGNLFNYSSRGPELDLVAPSGETNYLGNIRTTDRMGSAGRTSGNYENNFGGTSASCPVVSGVAALVLSVNPSLTQQEVRNILINTATDMGPNGFENNFGFGRVNALAAVEEAISNALLSGNNYICNFNSTFSLSQVPNGSTVNWSVSSNLQIISSSNSSATVKAINSTVKGNGFVRATVGARIITKNVWVGKPEAVTNLSHVSTFGCTMGEINVDSGGGANQYEWIISGGTIVIPSVNSSSYTGQGVIFVDPIDGPYGFTVKVRAKNICGSTSWYTKHIPTNCSSGGGGGGGATPLVNSIVLDDNIVIFPNPSSSYVFVNLNSLTNDNKEFDFQIRLLDVNGRVVFEDKTNRIFEQIDTSVFKNGFYVLTLSNGKEVVTKKLIIKH
ncbi:S8 family serine peptidase [Tamlana sp. 2201CG12-4]|uniref:S8 family serine peptidase n=1 Tax=Tamlana sp. 2201CG12-4 TaxID=3112582 RepID=UPI002DC04338|nr:S8 family serine peptidase [Tamlana sp. 2201CG12-4]MEC3905968.1 S8 family serine peptidase [Tamlana sp. 2201CG12-4]